MLLDDLRQRHHRSNDARRCVVHQVVGSIQFGGWCRFKLLNETTIILLDKMSLNKVGILLTQSFIDLFLSYLSHNCFIV
jgi:hypothetical protein